MLTHLAQDLPWYKLETEVKAKAGSRTRRDSLSKFPRLDAAQTWSMGPFPATAPSHALMCSYGDEEDAASDNRLVNETAGGLPLAGRVERRR